MLRGLLTPLRLPSFAARYPPAAVMTPSLAESRRSFSAGSANPSTSSSASSSSSSSAAPSGGEKSPAVNSGSRPHLPTFGQFQPSDLQVLLDGTPINVRDSFSLGMLFKNSVHVGHRSRELHPNMQNYVKGVKNDTHVIDLEQTLIALRRAVNVTREIAFKAGIILFVGTGPQLYDFTTQVSDRCHQYRVVGKWLGGTLTNAKTTLGTEAFMPDLVVFLNPEVNEVAVRETLQMSLPTIGICDTNVDPLWFTYPVPANDDSFRSVSLIGNILANAALEGETFRQQMRDEYLRKAKLAQEAIS